MTSLSKETYEFFLWIFIITFMFWSVSRHTGEGSREDNSYILWFAAKINVNDKNHKWEIKKEICAYI